jgi:hypothetical protein
MSKVCRNEERKPLRAHVCVKSSLCFWSPYHVSQKWPLISGTLCMCCPLFLVPISRISNMAAYFRTILYVLSSLCFWSPYHVYQIWPPISGISCMCCPYDARSANISLTGICQLVPIMTRAVFSVTYELKYSQVPSVVTTLEQDK